MKSLLKSNLGMTLLELMSVVVIVGVVASMAVPRMQLAFEKMNFQSANSDIQSSLRLARSQAITEKTPYGVYMNYWEGKVVIFKDSIVDVSNPYAFDEGDPVLREIDLPQEIEYMMTDVANDVITFNPNGSAGFNGSGNVSLHGYSMEGGCYDGYLNILPATGRIRSYDCWEEWAQNHDPYYGDYN